MTPKQEAFCIAYIETGNASEAYRKAYDAGKMKPESVNVNASKLLADAKIALRVAELKSELVERHKVTADTIAEMLREDREFAREMETPSAAVTATMGLAKLYGLLTDKTEVTGKDGAAIKIEAVKADAESFKRTIAGIAARIGAGGPT
jgi:phage terminase small subunit